MEKSLSQSNFKPICNFVSIELYKRLKKIIFQIWQNFLNFQTMWTNLKNFGKSNQIWQILGMFFKDFAQFFNFANIFPIIIITVYLKFDYFRNIQFWISHVGEDQDIMTVTGYCYIHITGECLIIELYFRILTDYNLQVKLTSVRTIIWAYISK